MLQKNGLVDIPFLVKKLVSIHPNYVEK